jgi:hypothetical protein
VIHGEEDFDMEASTQDYDHNDDFMDDDDFAESQEADVTGNDGNGLYVCFLMMTIGWLRQVN